MIVSIHSGRLVREGVHSQCETVPCGCPFTVGDCSLRVSIHSGRLFRDGIHSQWETVP